MKKALLLCAVMVVASGVVLGQAFKLTTAGGYLNVNGLFGPTGATEVVSKQGLGMGFGPFLGLGGKVRATAGSMQNMTWTGRLGYDVFQGKGGTPEKTNTTGILGIGVGAQYGLKPMMMGSKELKPYLGGEVQVNIVSPSYDSKTTNSGTRIGLGLGGGVDYPLNEKLSLDIGLKLSFMNLIAKGSTAADNIAPDAALFTSTTEGTWMHLSLNIGVNFSLAAAAAGGM